LLPAWQARRPQVLISQSSSERGPECALECSKMLLTINSEMCKRYFLSVQIGRDTAHGPQNPLRSASSFCGASVHMRKGVLSLGVLALATSVRAFTAPGTLPTLTRHLPTSAARVSTIRGGEPRPPLRPPPPAAAAFFPLSVLVAAHARETRLWLPCGTLGVPGDHTATAPSVVHCTVPVAATFAAPGRADETAREPA